MAEVILRDRLSEMGVEAEVASAGRMVGDQPASGGAVEVMAARGLDLSEHRSRTCAKDDLRQADLVLCMAREHLRDAALAHPDAFGRIFTLKELVRRGTAIGPRPASQDIAEWLSRAHHGRTHAGLLGSSEADDVGDPMGGSEEDYREAAELIDGLLGRVVSLMWPASNVDRPATPRRA